MGIVYLIQPAVYVGTNYFKIGMSSKDTIDRIKSYKLHTKVLCIYNCDEPENVEKKLIKYFTEKYKVIKGKEYFDAINIDKTLLQKEFMNVINEDQENCHSMGNLSGHNETVKPIIENTSKKMMHKLLKVSNEWWYKKDCILQQFEKDGIERIIMREPVDNLTDYQAFLYSKWKKYNRRYLNCQSIKNNYQLKYYTDKEFNSIVKNLRTVEDYDIKTNKLNLPIDFSAPIVC